LIFLVLPEIVMLFGLSFLDRYAWLRDSSLVYSSLRLAGVVSVFIGGWWQLHSAISAHVGVCRDR